MQTTISRQHWLSITALLLSLPAACFLGANILNEFGISGPYLAMDPLIERMGGRESLGLNINLLILFGPVIALLISVFQVTVMEWHFTNLQFLINIRIERKWFPIIVALLSICILSILFFYLLAENSGNRQPAI